MLRFFATAEDEGLLDEAVEEEDGGGGEVDAEADEVALDDVLEDPADEGAAWTEGDPDDDDEEGPGAETDE